MPKSEKTSEELVQDLVAKRPLSPRNQRKLWARYIALRTVLTEKGFLDDKDEARLLKLEGVLEARIDEKNEESVRRELGIKEG